MIAGFEITKRKLAVGVATAMGASSIAACGSAGVLPTSNPNENNRSCFSGACDNESRNGVVVKINKDGSFKVDTCAPGDQPLVDSYDDEPISAFKQSSLAEVEQRSDDASKHNDYCYFTVPVTGNNGELTESLIRSELGPKESIVGAVVLYDATKSQWEVAGHIS